MTGSADAKDSAKSFTSSLLVMRILLCHSATQICHSTMQGMALCLSVRLCAFVCVCVFAAFLEIPVKSEAGARYYLMSFCSESHLGF